VNDLYDKIILKYTKRIETNQHTHTLTHTHIHTHTHLYSDTSANE